MSEADVIALACEYACVSNHHRNLLRTRSVHSAFYVNHGEDLERCSDRMIELNILIDELDGFQSNVFRAFYWDKTYHLEGRRVR
jgi:hypothetical protein